MNNVFQITHNYENKKFFLAFFLYFLYYFLFFLEYVQMFF